MSKNHECRRIALEEVVRQCINICSCYICSDLKEMYDGIKEKGLELQVCIADPQEAIRCNLNEFLCYRSLSKYVETRCPDLMIEARGKCFIIELKLRVSKVGRGKLRDIIHYLEPEINKLENPCSVEMCCNAKIRRRFMVFKDDVAEDIRNILKSHQFCEFVKGLKELVREWLW